MRTFDHIFCTRGFLEIERSGSWHDCYRIESSTSIGRMANYSPSVVLVSRYAGSVGDFLMSSMVGRTKYSSCSGN